MDCKESKIFLELASRRVRQRRWFAVVSDFGDKFQRNNMKIARLNDKVNEKEGECLMSAELINK